MSALMVAGRGEAAAFNGFSPGIGNEWSKRIFCAVADIQDARSRGGSAGILG